jgi:hypothetical protein
MGGDDKEPKNQTHEMQTWKCRVDSEMKQAAEWEENWGFLKGMGSSHPPPPKATDYAPSEAESDFEIGGAKFKWVANRGLCPKEKYARPLTTQQEIGWRPSIELFGVSQHGVKRDPGIWAER